MDTSFNITGMITVVIPTYRRPKLLRRAVASVLLQSNPAFKIIIVDNASGDDTPYVAQMDRRIQLLSQKKHVGIAHNFQSGLDAVDTDYTLFLPDDDCIGPNLFKRAFEIFEKYPEIAFCGGGGLVFDEQYRFKGIEQQGQKIPKEGYYRAPQGYFAYLESTFGIAFPSLVFKTAVLRELGGVNVGLVNGIDEELVSKCAAKYPVYLLTNEPYYLAYHHPGQLTRSTDSLAYENDFRILKEAILPLLSGEDRRKASEFFEERLLSIWKRAFAFFEEQGEYLKAKDYAEKIWQKERSSKWRKRRNKMSLPIPLISLLTLLKNMERKIRKREIKVAKIEQFHQDSQLWKEYIHKLENYHAPTIETIS